MAPFIRGEFTYATDGRVIIRTREKFPDLVVADGPDDMFPVEAYFGVDSDFRPLPEIPAEESGPCSWCSDMEQETKDAVGCPECEGTGIEINLQSVPVGVRILSDHYLRLIEDALQWVTFAHDGDPTTPAEFRFEGGEGLLNIVRTNIKNDENN